MHAAGKKALFLRTYSPYASLFVFDDVEPEPTFGALLTDAGVKIARSPLRVDQRDDCIVIFDAGGEAHLLDVLYPALGCTVRSDIATNLGARCTETSTLEVDEHQQTTVECIYAVGEVVTDLHQLTVATGHAAVAATHTHNRLPANFR
jgi:thioredoxin reductase (NADPH)